MPERKAPLGLRSIQALIQIRDWLRTPVLLALLIPNVAFLGVHYLARVVVPAHVIRDRCLLAYSRGDLPTDPRHFDFLDSTRGIEPYGDANTLRMAMYRGPSALKDALAPRLLDPADGQGRHPVVLLREATFGTLAFDPQSGYYHRYWHGNVAVTSFLLWAFDLREMRLVLMNASYFLFMLVPLLAYAYSERLGIVLGVICGFGIWFSGLPYHGQTLAYAPAFIWSQMAVLPVLWFRRTARPGRDLIPLALVLGAIAAFLEPMSGAVVLGGCVFFLALYFSPRHTVARKRALQMAVAGLVAFLAGVFCSLLSKQIIAATFFGWDQTFGTLFSKLWWRVGMTGQKFTLIQMVGALDNSLIYLTFGSMLLRRILLYGSMAAFLTASIFVAIDVRRNQWRAHFIDYIAVLGAMALFPVWYVMLLSHTVIHAWITVRLLYMPFALCWVLLWLSARAIFARPTGACQETPSDMVATPQA
jgi:hypothetical protein